MRQGVEPAGNGRDPALPKILIGCAIVSGLATLVAFFSGGVGLGLVMLAVTVTVLWLASAQRMQPIEISVTRGVVYIVQGDSKHRFDLSNERTQVEMSGEPGDREWEVRFLRRGLDPFVVRDGMIDDPRALVGQPSGVATRPLSRVSATPLAASPRSPRWPRGSCCPARGC